MDYTQYFQTKTRSDGTKFVCRTDNAPEELAEMIRAIHFDCFDGCLPSDWIYSTILEAFGDLKHDELDNCSMETDVWDSDLIKWLEEPYAKWLCNDFGGEETDIIDKIRAGQKEAIRLIYHEVDSWIKSQA